MAITAAELATFDAAMLEIGTSGFATVTIAGQTVTVKSLKELADWRDRLAGQQATAADRAGLGIRIQQWAPYYP